MERYLTVAEQQHLLRTAQRVNEPLAQRDYHIMAALLYSGCRIGEFSRLCLGDVWSALKSGYLFLPREYRKGGRRDHRVLLTRPLRLHLVALLNLRGDGLAEDALVAGRFGGAMSVRSYQQRIAYWAEQAGLPMRVSPHFFRHSRAMNIMRCSEAADPRGIVQQALGHSSVATTGIYTAPSREQVAQVLEAVDGRGGRGESMAALRRDFLRRVG